jgi:hypothetical protein
MDTQEKTLAELFRSLQIAAHRYLREHYRKVVEEAGKESRKEIIDKIFGCLSEEEQKNMRSYIERVVEALKPETNGTCSAESGEGDYDFPFGNGHMGFYPCMGGFRHHGHWAGAHEHGGKLMDGFIMPF